jgi:hypothetical protein
LLSFLFWVLIKLRVEDGSPLSITWECPCLKVIILVLNSLYTPQVGLLVIVIEVFLSNKVTSSGIFIWIVFIAVFLNQTTVLHLIFDTLFFWIKIKLKFLWTLYCWRLFLPCILFIFFKWTISLVIHNVLGIFVIGIEAND